MRGDVVRVPGDRLAPGHEQKGARFGVIVQSDDLPLSTALVVPTTSRRSTALHRPEITLGRRATTLLPEPARAISCEALGTPVDRLSYADLHALDEALRLVLSLD